MVENAEELREKLVAQNEMTGPVFKVTNDPRVTSVGKVLRKLSLDELPQLINVLKGEMSLVGPRPPIPSEVEKYEPWQRRRLSMKRRRHLCPPLNTHFRRPGPQGMVIRAKSL